MEEKEIEFNANIYQVLFYRILNWLSGILNAIHYPVIIKPTQFLDVATGQQINIKAGKLFTTISIGNRDYFFHRITGKYDGSGYQLKCD